MLEGIREVEPDAAFAAFTIRPADTEARHGIPSFPLRRGPAPRTAASAAPGAPATGTAAPSAPPGPSGARAALRRVPGLGTALSRAAAAVRWLGESRREAAFWAVRYRHMRRVDLLVVAGSNQLSDYFGGPWGFPYTLWAWSLAARLAGARVVFLSVGAGPIRAGLSRFFLRTALSWSSYRSYRDVGSREAVAGMGFPGPYIVAPDLAHGLRVSPIPRSAPGVGQARTVVINPLPYFDPRYWAERDFGIYRRYVDTLATFATSLVRRGDRVRFVPSQLRVDPPVIADILQAMHGGSGGPGDPAALARLEVLTPPEDLAPDVSTFDDFTARLSEADYVVATRFHGVLLSQMLGKPTIGIVYRRSTRDLLTDVGQGDYAVEIREITPEKLLDRLTALERDPDASDRIQRRLESYREALAAQYALVLALHRGARRA